MNSFVNNISNQIALTENGMTAHSSSSSSALDLFYKIGSARGRDISADFVKAYVEDSDLAIRILLWARDIRGGAGERDLFRSTFKFMFSNVNTYGRYCMNILMKLPEIGRWDDLLVVFDATTGQPHMDDIARRLVSTLFIEAITSGNGLAAKWAPRQGSIANFMRREVKMSRGDWRRFVVRASKTVEQNMCARDWENINYAHVPSQAARIYAKAFQRHDRTGYDAYKTSLIKGETKINAATLYPYQVIRDMRRNNDVIIAEEQWKALPDYVGDQNILPLIDVSGSMSWSPVDKSGLTPMDVAVSLGFYLAEKNKGAYKDVFLTFSQSPELNKVSGTLKQKLNQIMTSKWGYNTNIEAAFRVILDHARMNKVPQEDMPEYLLILSDMQFDPSRDHGNPTALQLVRTLYEESDYKMPKVVFWNLNASYDNVPAKQDNQYVAMVSGFSPAIMKSILSGVDFNPASIMMETIMNPRYDFLMENDLG